MPTTDPPPANGGATSKAKKKNKKKKPAAPGPSNGDAAASQDHDSDQVLNGEEHNVETEEEQTDVSPPAKDDQQPISEQLPPKNQPRSNGIPNKGKDGDSENASDLTEKLDAAVKERDNLLSAVSELRKSLEDIQAKHKQDITELETKLGAVEEEKEEANSKYDDLRERVTVIRATLGERLKSNAEEIAQANSRIEELEENNKAFDDRNAELEESVSKLKSHGEQMAKEIDTLRSRSNLSQQNWVKERDELIRREAQARDEFEDARTAMQDWEVLAMEERSLRKNLSDKVAELEDQLSNLQETHERAVSERDSQSQTVDGLQRALRDIQEERRRELREMVESHKAQMEEISKQQQIAEDASISAKEELDKTQKELERALPFEKEVKEKNLQIGKLRHNGVVLNDHLTKALRYIKQRSPEDMVDRQVLTNSLLHFLTLDRADHKKFQVLQVIANILGWDDDQKSQAGLSRPGGLPPPTNSSLRIPLTPFRKASSANSLQLNAENSLMEQRASKESLAELWSDFLEREAANSEGSTRRASEAGGAGTLPATPTETG